MHGCVVDQLGRQWCAVFLWVFHRTRINLMSELVKVLRCCGGISCLGRKPIRLAITGLEVSVRVVSINNTILLHGCFLRTVFIAHTSVSQNSCYF